MTEQQTNLEEKNNKSVKTKERQFKGMSLSERKQARREKLIEAGIESSGTHGFFAVKVRYFMSTGYQKIEQRKFQTCGRFDKMHCKAEPCF